MTEPAADPELRPEMSVPKRDRHRFGFWWGALRWLIAAGLLVLILRSVDLGRLWSLVGRMSLPWFGAAVLTALADRVVMCAKWLPLLRAQIPDYPRARAVRGYFAASVGVLVLPGAGADALRAVALGRGATGSGLLVGASVVAERALGIAGSGVAAVVSLLLARHLGLPLPGLTPWIAGLAGLGSILVLLPVLSRGFPDMSRILKGRGGRAGRLMTRLAEAYVAYRDHPGVWFGVWAASVFEQGMPAVALWCVARALGADVSVLVLLVATPLTMIVARLPVSVAGLGVFEGGMVYLLTRMGVSSSEALGIALGGRVLDVIVLMPGVIWWTELTGRSIGIRNAGA